MRRPLAVVLILTRDSVIPYLTSITVAPITSTLCGIRSEVVLAPAEDGVLVVSVVNVDNLQTVQKCSLDSYLTHLSRQRMREVRAAIEFALGFDALR